MDDIGSEPVQTTSTSIGGEDEARSERVQATSDSDSDATILNYHLNEGIKVYAYKRKKAKEARLHGREYTGFKRFKTGKITHETGRSQKELRARCSHEGNAKSAASLRCGLISDGARLRHFNEFWCLKSWESKQTYVKALLGTRGIKRRRSGKNKDTSLKQVCHECYLKSDSGVKVLV